MLIASLTGHYGAKRMQAPGIVEAIGDHTAYFEPFCGSMAVLFAKPKARMEVVNDLHEWLINMARVVQDDSLSVRLFDRLERTVFCEALYYEAQTWLQHRDAELHPAPDAEPKWACRSLELDLDAAYYYFVTCWMGKGGFAGSQREMSVGLGKRYTSNGGDPATRFRNAVASLPWWWQRLQGVAILSEDAIALIGKVEDKVGTVTYCDPPYLLKGVQYLHDFALSDDTAEHPLIRMYGDHGRLALVLSRFQKTRVVVSYYDSPLLDELYPAARGWKKVVRSTTKQMGNGKNEAPEVLLVLN